MSIWPLLLLWGVVWAVAGGFVVYAFTRPVDPWKSLEKRDLHPSRFPRSVP